jgi:hypothetical protein
MIIARKLNMKNMQIDEDVTEMFTMQLVYLCSEQNMINDKNANDIHCIISSRSLAWIYWRIQDK